MKNKLIPKKVLYYANLHNSRPENAFKLSLKGKSCGFILNTVRKRPCAG